MEQLEKEKQIKREESRLKRTFKDLSKNTLDTVRPLIKNAAFMAVTLENLQEEINKTGITCSYKNGENQFGTKKTPEVETYNTMIKNYASVIKQLCEFLPEGQKEGDELLEFLAGRVPGTGGKK